MRDIFISGQTQITNGRIKMKRTRLRPRSKTSLRSKLLKIYEDRKKIYLAQSSGCEICGCNPSTNLDLHHKAGRYGKSPNEEGEEEHNLINPKTFMALCRMCHDEVHRSPSASREKGWLI